MKLYGAIDLHSTNNVTVLIDEEDRIVYQKRLPLFWSDTFSPLLPCHLQNPMVDPGERDGSMDSRANCVHERFPRAYWAEPGLPLGSRWRQFSHPAS